ncbi:MAG: glycogen/starch/alpha-glucan phosphorylase [Oscillospiraceae bacterium]|nr:glycogen/starch/alpha-glucan phosphorylase [Oscillospiraceae bacterium]
MTGFSKAELKEGIAGYLQSQFSTDPGHASNEQFYKASALLVKEILNEKQKKFMAYTHSHGNKQVYYLCMEFLLGRSLKNSLYNLEIVGMFTEALADWGVNIEQLYELEPDPGLGNGGLGRLAACFMDGLATQDYPAMGYSICYEYGIFKQKIIGGWQTELPDYWLPGGDVWLIPNAEMAVDVHFGGEVEEFWDWGYHHINYKNYTTVKAVPCDMLVSGYASQGVSRLRLWKAVSPGIDMESFNRGDYVGALGQNSMAEVISKVLYPNDNHNEGKALRLRQQYFLVAASVGDIVNSHMSTYGTLDNLPDKVAIHLNDTHPALAIPELMRILLDDCGYDWEKAWNITSRVFSYTNHTVMPEALEMWNEDLFKALLPRVHQIVCEINRRFCWELENRYHAGQDKISRMSIVLNRTVRMANLSVMGSHKVNGVSKLHSEIIKDETFHDFYTVTPDKFTNVTNGIASRRWLAQSNPGLTGLIRDCIGDGFMRDMSRLSELNRYLDDSSVLERMARIKKANKETLAAAVKKRYGIVLNTDSIFDVQVKRLHEYKRQHLNALHILSLYQYLKENPGADIAPRTFIFGAKAAPGYYLAKQIIKFICSLQEMIEADPAVRDVLRIVYLENYSVTASELLMPASEVSEQISLAGTEASGTGNMKLMLSGAVTLGTYDGANVEICDAVGRENMVLFGMSTEEVDALRKKGYNPFDWCENDPVIKKAIAAMNIGIAGNSFPDITESLLKRDPFMVLADFESYRAAQQKVQRLYADSTAWQRMSLKNVAESGYFCADRSVREYARNIWEL